MFTINKNSEAELMRLKAALKRAELQVQSLEQQVEQKVSNSTLLKIYFMRGGFSRQNVR